MYLFPYKKILVETELSSKNVLQELQDEIEPIKFTRLIRNDWKSFEGKIDNTNFHLRIPPLVSSYSSNSFNPQISWKIAESDHKTQIFLTFWLNKFVLFFLAFIYIFVLWDFLSILIHFRITLNDLKSLGIFSLLYVYVMYFWNRWFTLTFDKLVIILHAHPVSKKSV